VNDNWVKGAELARADALKPVSVAATAEWKDAAPISRAGNALK